MGLEITLASTFILILSLLVLIIINVGLAPFMARKGYSIQLKFTERRFKGSKDPIYKLEKGKYLSYYGVYKYELGYKESDNFWFYLLPLSFLLSTYGYIKSEKSVGVFSDTDIENGFTLSLEEIWNNYQKLINIKWSKKLLFKDKLDIINSEFNEHYKD